MKVRYRLLVAVGLMGLLVAPGLVRAVSVGDTCAGQWLAPSHSSCEFVSGEKISVFAGALEAGASGTVSAVAVIDGVNRTIVSCSFGEAAPSEQTLLEPDPVSVFGIVEASPAPTQAPTVDATVTPPAIKVLGGSPVVPSACNAKRITNPGVPMRCIANGTRRGTFGCTGVSN